MITILKQMQTKLDHIVSATLARHSLNEVDKEELLMLTHEFPYAPVLQFLYTKRLQQSQDPRFGDSVTRTALFFNNPHWLYQQLRDTTAVEQLRDEDVTRSETVSMPDFSGLGNEETLEHEGDPHHILTPSEQALIASITEAPDESLLMDEARRLEAETTEHETSTDTSEDWVEEMEESQELTNLDEEIATVEIAAEPSEWPNVADDGITDATIFPEESANESIDPEVLEGASVVDVDVLPATEAFDSLTEPIAISEQEVAVDQLNDSLEQEVSVEHAKSDLNSADVHAPLLQAVITEEIASVIEMEAAEPILEADQIPDELPQITSLEAEKVPAEPDNTETLPASIPEEQQAEIVHSSFITVIASVEPIEAHPIHTIGDSEESDNDDDASLQARLPEDQDPPLSDEPPAGTQVSAPIPDFDSDTDAEEGNDDDNARLIDEQPFEEIPSGSAIDITDEEQLMSSGLENLGFLPETLLEDSDAAVQDLEEEGGAVFSSAAFREGWEAFESPDDLMAEDDDHPDATDPGEDNAYDLNSPGINPGDLIKMAGLDQHYETELSFEPLHLTDYFASVGVSLPPEEQPDVFGRQSRSFTGWIRAMKRIHPEKSTTPFTQSESEQIRAVADQSNEQEEVLIETMAGIYAMQGLTNKAIDIYEKLSLLNPEKSAIFATKLSELKGTSS